MAHVFPEIGHQAYSPGRQGFGASLAKDPLLNNSAVIFLRALAAAMRKTGSCGL